MIRLADLRRTLATLQPAPESDSVQWNEFRRDVHVLRVLILGAPASAEKEAALALLGETYGTARDRAEQARERESAAVVMEFAG
jgi:hypothetical protein